MNILKDSFKDSIKYILTRVFVLFIVGIIFIAIFYFIGRKYEKLYTFFGIEKAYALTFQGSVYTGGMQSTSWTQSVNSGTGDIYKQFFWNNQNMVYNDYDLIGIKVNRFSIRFNDDSFSTREMTCSLSISESLNGNLYTSNYYNCQVPLSDIENSQDSYYTLFAYINTDKTGKPCWLSDEIKDVWLCPLSKDEKLYNFELHLNYDSPYNFSLDFQTSGFNNFYNYDSNVVVNGLSGIQNNQNQIINSLNDSDTSFSGSSFTTFINNYTNTIPNNITRIVATPLQTIVNLQGSTCSPLQLNIPFLNQQLVLPCMSEIYQQYFGSFFTLYQLIVSGLVTYWCIIGILNTVKSLLDANDDKIEVLDL